MYTNSPSENKKPRSFNRGSESSTRRKRTVFSKAQLSILINYFQKNRYPGIEEREELSKMTDVPEGRIQVWFQNRRARQGKRLESPTSTTSGREMEQENSSPSQILKKDLPEHELTLPSVSSSCTDLEPSQEDGQSSSCSMKRRKVASPPEAAYSYGDDSSQSQDLGSFSTMRPSTQLQPCALPRPEFPGSSSQCASSLALQGTQGPENYGPHTSFCDVKPPAHGQELDRTEGQLYSNNHPFTHCLFRVHNSPHVDYSSHNPSSLTPSSLQPVALQPLMTQHSTIQGQQLTPSRHQLPQENQVQTQPSSLVRGEEQPYGLFPSFNQELSFSDLPNRTIKLESTQLLPDGHLTASHGNLPEKPNAKSIDSSYLDELLSL